VQREVGRGHLICAADVELDPRTNALAELREASYGIGR
jgi:hypothetical protein